MQRLSPDNPHARTEGPSAQQLLQAPHRLLFIFGFLLTVFPRWMGLPNLSRWRNLPIGAALLAILLSMTALPDGFATPAPRAPFACEAPESSDTAGVALECSSATFSCQRNEGPEVRRGGV